MKTGALIFAINNEQTDYIAMARWQASNIERHLGIPTQIVTDSDVEIVGNNGRYFDDYQENVTWHNESRATAYEVSQWDQTLVLDADYVVASDQLKVLLESNQDFLAPQTAYDVTGLNTFASLNAFGNYRMPMSWATVMMFRRSELSKSIFDSMLMVRDNWTHYRNLYQNRVHTFRNDHALSIALNIVYGQTMSYPSVPWSLPSLTPEHTLTELAQDHYRIDYQDPRKKKHWITLKNHDFHAMGKKQLGEIVARYQS